MKTATRKDLIEIGFSHYENFEQKMYKTFVERKWKEKRVRRLTSNIKSHDFFH